MGGGVDETEAAGTGVGGEATPSQRWVVHRFDQPTCGVGVVHVRRDDAGGALIEHPEGQRRFVGADPHQHVDPVQTGCRDVLPQRDQVGGTVLAVDQEEVEAADRDHLDQLLGRHPQQHAEQLLAGQSPGSQRHHATIPADRSMSAPQSPGIASMATAAAPTSVSVTIRPRAARETKVSTASS